MDYSTINKILFFSLSNAFIIFVWLNTDFFIEYYKLFKIKGLKVADEHIKRNESGFIEIFPDFLKKNSRSFFTKIISCPICLGTWISFLSIPHVGYNFLIVAYFSLFFYYLLLIFFKLSDRL